MISKSGPRLNAISMRADTRQSYSYHPHNRQHKFCPICGTSIVILPNDKIQDAGKIGINLRTVEGVDVGKLKLKAADGRARDPSDEMREWQSAKTMMASGNKQEEG